MRTNQSIFILEQVRDDHHVPVGDNWYSTFAAARLAADEIELATDRRVLVTEIQPDGTERRCYGVTEPLRSEPFVGGFAI